MRADAAVAALIDAASAPYRTSGPYAYHFARGKLAGDPFFVRMLELGLLQGRDRLLDLGCGQGLLAAWLVAAQALHAGRDWPPTWPAPPQPRSMAGIDISTRDIHRARGALGGRAQFAAGDLRDTGFAGADAITILDVLHYIEPATQRRILQRARAALPADGLLLLRIGDANGGLRSRISRSVDQCLLFLRSGAVHRLHRRPLPEWLPLLAATGFRCEPVAMRSATPFADVLLDCRPA